MEAGFGLGPRFTPVARTGNDVFVGRHLTFGEGAGKVVGPPVFDLKIGSVSPLPFLNTVTDARGNKIGELTTPIQGRQSLKRW